MEYGYSTRNKSSGWFWLFLLLFFFFLFFFQYSSSFTPQVLLLSLQAFPDDARIIAAGRGRIAVEGDSNP